MFCSVIAGLKNRAILLVMKCPLSFSGIYAGLSAVCRMPHVVLLTLSATLAGLATVYIAQFGFDYKPCELCLFQRLPYWTSFILCLLTLRAGRQPYTPLLLVLLVLTWVTSAGLGFYHAGVEQHWWVYGGACSGAGKALTAETLLATPIQRCDEISWTFLGLSMATWNVPFSLLIATLLGLTYAKTYK